MRATTTFRALCLGATLGLTACVSVHHDRDYDRHEPYGNYDDGDDYGAAPYGPRYSHGGFDHVWYPSLGVYTVIGFPSVYWHDGWYWRHAHGYWERCASARGRHWSRVDWGHVPHRFRGRHADRRDERWDRREDRWDHRDERRDDRHDRRDDRREDRHERAEDRRDPRDERRDDRHERVEQRHDERQERVEAKRERREDRRDDRSERVEARHEQRGERKDARHERVEQRHEARGERRDERKEQHDEKREERLAERR
jgi:hypothetical protein